ncbi:MAG: hypothetical protein ABI411_10665 [Tahibacter sp.]
MQVTDTRAASSQRWLRGTALAIDATVVALALLATSLSGTIERVDTHGFALFNAEIAATPTFIRFSWAYTLLGGTAIALAITAYLGDGLRKKGKVALLLGIVALAWKHVIYGIMLAVVLAVLMTIGS